MNKMNKMNNINKMNEIAIDELKINNFYIFEYYSVPSFKIKRVLIKYLGIDNHNRRQTIAYTMINSKSDQTMREFIKNKVIFYWLSAYSPGMHVYEINQNEYLEYFL